MADTDDQESLKGRKLTSGELRKLDVLGWWKLGLQPGQTLLDEDDADKEANRILFGTIGDIVQVTTEEVLGVFLEAFDDQVASNDEQPLRTGDMRDALDLLQKRSAAITDRVIERFVRGEAPYSERVEQDDTVR